MSIFTKMTIGGRLRLVFGSLFVVLMFVGGVGLYQARQIYKTAESLGTDGIPSLVLMGRLAELVMRFRELEAAAILSSDADGKAVVAQRQAKTLADIKSAWKSYQPLIDVGEEPVARLPAEG